MSELRVNQHTYTLLRSIPRNIDAKTISERMKIILGDDVVAKLTDFAFEGDSLEIPNVEVHVSNQVIFPEFMP